MSDTNYVIEVQDLKKHYNGGKVKALNGVSFKLIEGRVYGLIGPNGAGKTTLVKSLLGAIKPTTGHIHIFNEEAGSVNANDRIGYVCEKNALPLNEDPFEYLLTMAILSKLDRKIAKEKIRAYLIDFGLEKFMYNKMKSFSSGMKKKVQIIAALLSDPQIMLLDEPTANLDPKVRSEIFSFIKDSVINKNITVILCSHNLFELEKIVDDIIMINKGRKVIQGEYEEIISKIKKSNSLTVKTSENQKLKTYIETLPGCNVSDDSPLTIDTDNMKKLKQGVIEFSFKNKIVIDEMVEVKDSLFDIFDHFNQESGDLNDEV